MARTYSASAPVAEVLTLLVDPAYNHLFVTANYYTDATLSTPVIPTAGTIAIQGKPNGAGGYADLAGSPIPCTDTGAVASTNVPLESVLITPDTITGAAYYQIKITAKDK